MPDLIRHPVPSWIPAPFLRRGRHAGMTTLRYLIAGVIIRLQRLSLICFEAALPLQRFP
jgi:hypothetical protein